MCEPRQTETMMLANGRYPCNHMCKNKANCAHPCCKNGKMRPKSKDNKFTSHSQMSKFHVGTSSESSLKSSAPLRDSSKIFASDDVDDPQTHSSKNSAYTLAARYQSLPELPIVEQNASSMIIYHLRQDCAGKGSKLPARPASPVKIDISDCTSESLPLLIHGAQCENTTQGGLVEQGSVLDDGISEDECALWDACFVQASAHDSRVCRTSLQIDEPAVLSTVAERSVPKQTTSYNSPLRYRKRSYADAMELQSNSVKPQRASRISEDGSTASLKNDLSWLGDCFTIASDDVQNQAVSQANEIRSSTLPHDLLPQTEVSMGNANASVSPDVFRQRIGCSPWRSNGTCDASGTHYTASLTQTSLALSLNDPSRTQDDSGPKQLLRPSFLAAKKPSKVLTDVLNDQASVRKPPTAFVTSEPDKEGSRPEDSFTKLFKMSQLEWG